MKRRSPRSLLLPLLPLLLLVGCMDEDPPTAPSRPDAVLSSVSHAAHGGAHGVYFLPPMVTDPAFRGSFDAALSPVVEACATAACERLHASFSMAGDGGSETVRLDEREEHYLVDWHTNRTGAAAGRPTASGSWSATWCSDTRT